MTTHKDNAFIQKYGPYAFVTGASDGIGRELAKELAQKGLNLILVARREDTLNTLARDLQASSSVKVEVLALDVSEDSSLNKITDFCASYDIGLFAGVAGFGSSGEFAKCELTGELNMIDVNCRSVVAQAHYFANRFQNNARGGMILMGSLVGFQGVPYSATYAASKAFVQSFAEALHFELKPYGVHVLSSAPGPVQSGFGSRAHMNLSQAASPSEVAQATIKALGRQITVRPGFLAKFLGWSLILLPRILRIKIMGIIMAKMHE